jgi:hypothetical protein
MDAKQITPRVQRWLRHSHAAGVHQLFAEVCTLVNERAEVISLVSPNVGPGPFAAVLEGDFTAGLDIDQPVALDHSKQTLTVGPSIVNFRESTLWRPRPDWSQLRDADFDHWPTAAGLPAEISHHLKLTVEGIRVDDPSLYLAGLVGLVGRGEGLTPTGDDVLMGVLYGFWVWQPHRLQRLRSEGLKAILTTAVSRTTTLSANYLCVAAAGEATWHWHDLVSGRPQAVERILAIGHTSGADAWAGFTYTGSVLRIPRPFLNDGTKSPPPAS